MHLSKDEYSQRALDESQASEDSLASYEIDYDAFKYALINLFDYDFSSEDKLGEFLRNKTKGSKISFAEALRFISTSRSIRPTSPPPTDNSWQDENSREDVDTGCVCSAFSHRLATLNTTKVRDKGLQITLDQNGSVAPGDGAEIPDITFKITPNPNGTISLHSPSYSAVATGSEMGNAFVAPTSSSLLPVLLGSVDGEDEDPVSRRKQLVLQARARAEAKCRPQKEKPSFFDLPEEVRVRIYRMLFFSKAPIVFNTRKDLSRSAAFLRTCRLINHEGRLILYGDNSFHFERNVQRRGRLFDKVWKEIGFKDVRSFLLMIGGHNIAHLKFVSFDFYDGYFNKTTAPSFKEDKMRYVNDIILHHALRLIGRYAILEKIVVTFAGRRIIRPMDFQFLHALASIKSYEVIQAKHSWRESKDTYGVFEELRKSMTLPARETAELDPTRVKLLNRPMQYQHVY